VRRILLAVAVALALVIVPAVADEVIQLPPVEVRSAHPLVPASYRDTPLPPYPAAAREQGLEGVVLLDVRVRADGRVGDVRVKTSSGAGELDESAVTAVKRWTFVPARRGPRTVERVVEVPVHFALSQR
jgi:protein TonB